jgi:phage/plasmid primase-like uncharacterized protein
MADNQNIKKLSYGEVVSMAKNDPETFATALIGSKPTYRGGTSVRYYDNQSLQVNTGGPHQGRFKSHVDDTIRGDMLDLVRHMRGLPDDKAGRHQAIEVAKEVLGVSDGVADVSKLPPVKTDLEKKREQEAAIAKRKRVANWIWESASETEGREEGYRYLRNRGITIELPSDVLRFSVLSRDELKKMGLHESEIPATPVTALVFKAQNAAGEVTAVQQVLTTDGAKLKCKIPKRTNGLVQGSAVILGDITKSDTTITTEGPETGMSLYQATGHPVMIVLGKSNFIHAPVPENITTLITAADMEPAGRGLADALRAAQHYTLNGMEKSGIALPLLNDGDFNDVLQNDGDAAVAKAVERTYFAPKRDFDATLFVTPDARAAFHAWRTTGIDVVAKIPGKDKEGKFLPLMLDSVVTDEYSRVFLVATKGIEVKDEYIRKSRPELEIVTLSEDSKAFRSLAKTPGKMEAIIAKPDIHAPEGFGTKEPVFFTLRRADAEALSLPGHKSIAVRSTAVGNIDLSFMNGRTAIVAPIGNGTDKDRALTERLEAAGAQTTRLTWQIFPADQPAPKIVRSSVPPAYGAADAAAEGWKGEALKDLVEISRANHAQMEADLPQKQAKQQAR